MSDTPTDGLSDLSGGKDFHRQRLSSAIASFVRELDDYPGWREWNRGKFGHTLYFDDEFWRPDNRPAVFEFDPVTEKRHAVIMRYFSLLQTPDELRDLQFYFRRYPYAGTTITRYSHLSNCCELYFGRYYQYKERLKELFDAVEAAVGAHNLAIGKFIKTFDREFSPEIRERNSIHHRERFEDIEISRLFMVESVILSNPKRAGMEWEKGQKRYYRKAASTWAKRCVEQSERLDVFTEAVAEALLKVCPFLKPENAAALNAVKGTGGSD